MIANNDIVSTDVLVIGDRVISNDISRVVNTRTTELFQSSSSPNREEEFPWAYLFEINDFAAYENAEGVEINYTDESWVLDKVNGYFVPLGDGGGDFKTETEIRSAYLGFEGNPRLIDALLQRTYTARIDDYASFNRRLYTGISPTLSKTPFAGGDGVSIGDYLFIAAGANESIRYGNYVSRIIYPDRDYWVYEENLGQNWGYTWQPVDENSSGEIRSIGVAGNASGELRRACRIIFEEADGTPKNYIVTVYADGNTLVTGGTRRDRDRDRGRLISQASSAFNTLSSNGYREIKFPIPSLEFHKRIFKGQQVIDDAINREIAISGNIPNGFNHRGERFYRLVDDSFKIYRSSFYLIPEVSKRTSGVKSIYVQVRDRPKVLLHQIPAFEAYTGHISPLPGNQLEVVLNCGKQFPEDRSLSNYNLWRGEARNGRSKAEREWAQKRVYRLDSSGKVIPDLTEIFNNALTDANPSRVSDEIIISPDNWQFDWLNQYKDYRFPGFEVNDYDELGYIYFELNSRIGEVVDLNSAYRTYKGDRSLSYQKGTPSKLLIRNLISYVGLGTLTDRGFVYLAPENLFDLNVELDYSFKFDTRFFPHPNYSVFSGLVNGNQTQKRYFLLKESEYRNDIFIPGITIEKVTQFPKLDLKDEIAQGVVIPKQITRSDWSTEWSVEPGVETDLLRFAIIAIAYLG